MSLSTCLLIVSINLIVDPYSLNGWIEKSGFNYIKPAFRGNQWIAKVFEVSRKRPSVIFLGTSRAAHGLDPLHPALAGKITYNLATDGAQIAEIKELFEHSVNTSKIDIAIIGLDLVSFSNNTGNIKLRHDLMDIGGRQRSDSRQLEIFRASLSIETLWDSYQTVQSQQTPSEFTHDGQRTDEYYANFINEYGGVRAACEGYMKEISHNRKKITTVENQNASFQWDDIQSMLKLAKQQNIELYFFISPTHAWDLEYLRAWGEWNRFLNWKRDLVKVIDDQTPQEQDTKQAKVVLWDFSGYNSITTENIPASTVAHTNMQYFWEFSHYRTLVGGWILERVLGVKQSQSQIPDDFGVKLTQNNIEAQITDIELAREKYVQQNAQDVAFINNIVQSTIHSLPTEN
ncbi:hypothetical protein [Methylomonas sp. MK1]|uniref:hypothetical protein n=1 Tax=Methylomonas sp. MK1 TaxID=1131552 RepID=UPI0012689844|nr:hypothetical protein [Methylomonas sp. MK1]